MERKKLILTQRQIELLAENELDKMKREGSSEEMDQDDDMDSDDDDTPKMSGLDSMIGEPGDRKIKYPSAGDIEAVKSGMDKDDADGEEDIEPIEMKTPPHELLDYLDKIDEAKSILSKIAAKQDNENIKNRIYSHYEKAQKLAFELIKEFGIVH